jgi:hypothetical protein
MMTKHMQSRMNQRGIFKDLVDLALQYGEPDGDKVRLGRKEIDRLVSGLDTLRATAMKARDKGGLVVVAVGESLVTTYGFEG